MNIKASYNNFIAIRNSLLKFVNVIENSYDKNKKIQHAIDGSIKFADCYIIEKILAKEKPQTCLEIGSFLGFSTRWLLDRTNSWNMHVTAIDPNIRHRIFDNPRWVVEGINANYYPDRLEIISGFFGKHGYYSSDYKNYLPYRSKEWVKNLLTSRIEIDGTWSRKFDCIFIDADHHYNSVIDGFKHAVNLLNPNGFIIFHDAISWPDVARALNDIKKQYQQNADVDIIDGSQIFDHPELKQEPIRNVDGIGLFKLLH